MQLLLHRLPTDVRTQHSISHDVAINRQTEGCRLNSTVRVRVHAAKKKVGQYQSTGFLFLCRIHFFRVRPCPSVGPYVRPSVCCWPCEIGRRTREGSIGTGGREGTTNQSGQARDLCAAQAVLILDVRTTVLHHPVA